MIYYEFNVRMWIIFFFFPFFLPPQSALEVKLTNCECTHIRHVFNKLLWIVWMPHIYMPIITKCVLLTSLSWIWDFFNVFERLSRSRALFLFSSSSPSCCFFSVVPKVITIIDWNVRSFYVMNMQQMRNKLIMCLCPFQCLSLPSPLTHFSSSWEE